MVKKNKNQIDISRLYSLEISSIWKAMRAEHISLISLCIYFLFEYIRPQSLYPVIDVLPWSMVFLILTLIAAIMDKSVKWVSCPTNKLIIFFSIIVVLSGIFAFRPESAWKHKEVMGGWLLVYFLVLNIVNTEKRMFLFVLCYLIFNLKMAQHGVVTWASRGFSFAGFGLIGSPGYFRNSGEYAIQMLIFGSLSLAFIFSLKDYFSRNKIIILLMAAATGYMAVLGASSRGAQIALLGIGVWWILQQRNGVKGILLMVVIGSLLYSILPEEQLQRFSEMGEDRNSLQRLTYWQEGLKIISDFPVLGVGYFNWIDYMRDLYPDGIGVLEKVEVSHNIFIQAGSELGIPGLILFVLLIIYVFKLNAQTRKLLAKEKNSFLFYLSYGLDAGLIGFLVAGSFVTVLFYPFFWTQLSMTAALYSVATKLNPDKNDKNLRKLRRHE